MPTATNLNEIKTKKPEFFLKNFLPIPKSSITMISAPGGSGKSFFAIQIAIQAVLEQKARKILLWLSEDPSGLTKYRAQEIAKKILNLNEDEIKEIFENIFIVDEMPAHLTPKSFDLYKEFLEMFEIVVLDPLIAFFGGEENSNTQARYFMNMINAIARENMQSVILVHHSSKNKEVENRARGASAFVDAVRLQYQLESIKNSNSNKKIKVSKDNFGVRTFWGEEREIEVLPFITEIIREEKKSKRKQVPYNQALEITIVDDDEEIESEEALKIKQKMERKGVNFE